MTTIDTNKVRMQFREDHSIASAMIYGLCDELDEQRRMTSAAWDNEQHERAEFREEIAGQRHHIAKLRAVIDHWDRLSKQEDHEWLLERNELYVDARNAENLIDGIERALDADYPSLAAISAMIVNHRSTR